MATVKVPLSFMTKLSSAAYTIRPTSKWTGHGPNLVVLLGWMNARDVHLAKYVEQYVKTFPAATIVLITARLAVIGSHAKADAAVAPAMSVILSTRELDNAPPIHVHLFSNGGSALLTTLYRAFGKTAARKFPKHITIFDSAPWTKYDYHRTILAIMIGIPPGFGKILAGPFIRLLCLYYYFLFKYFSADIFVKIAAIHNDKRQVDEVERVYIYSHSDALVTHTDVEEHAADAASKGFKVRTELFIGSQHVAHARTDHSRYWRIVEELWKDKPSSTQQV